MSEASPAALGERAWSRLLRVRRLSLALSPGRAGVAIALVMFVYGMANLRSHGVTYDEPALMYAGDRTLYWAQHFGAKGTLDLQAPDPADFQSAFLRKPQVEDVYHYPVLPGFIAAVASWLVHDKLGLVAHPIDGHHVGLIAIHAVALYLFCVYLSRLFGLAAGVAGTLALALYPTAVGHMFNNAKDWPCAMYYGCFVLALASGVVDGRFRDFVLAGVLLGVAFAGKMNAAFALITIALWSPLAYFVLYRGRQLPVGVASGYLLIPYIGGAVFFISWPWLYQGNVLDWWMHIHEYVRFMVDFGVGKRETWSAHSLKCVFYMSQPLVLAAAAVYLASGWRAARRELALYLLFVLWLGLPLLRVAVPRSNFYDANRHFIEYIPALCACAGVGAAAFGGWLSGVLRSGRLGLALERRRRVLFGGVAIGACALLAWPVLEYRPFEAAYFNVFAGGLGGAVQRGVFAAPLPQDHRVNGTEGDYWFSSTRRALLRAAKHTQEGETIGVCGPPEWLAQSNWTGSGVRHFADRDLSPERFEKASVIVVVWREISCSMVRIRELESKRPILNRVTRGGALIYEILGPPDGNQHPVKTRETLYSSAEWLSTPH